MTAIVGRTAIQSAIVGLELPPVGASPRLEAVAHVICRMGGHIPHVDNEAAGACDHHRRHALIALAQADEAVLAARPVEPPDPLARAARTILSCLSAGAVRRLPDARPGKSGRHLVSGALVPMYLLADLEAALDGRDR